MKRDRRIGLMQPKFRYPICACSLHFQWLEILWLPLVFFLADLGERVWNSLSFTALDRSLDKAWFPLTILVHLSQYLEQIKASLIL